MPLFFVNPRSGRGAKRAKSKVRAGRKVRPVTIGGKTYFGVAARAMRKKMRKAKRKKNPARRRRRRSVGVSRPRMSTRGNPMAKRKRRRKGTTRRRKGTARRRRPARRRRGSVTIRVRQGRRRASSFTIRNPRRRYARRRRNPTHRRRRNPPIGILPHAERARYLAGTSGTEQFGPRPPVWKRMGYKSPASYKRARARKRAAMGLPPTKARRKAAKRRARGATRAVRYYRAIKHWPPYGRRRKPTKLGRRMRKGQGRGLLSLRKARRTTLYQRAYGGKRQQKVLSQFRMRANPIGGIVDGLKRAFPVAIAFYGGKVLTAMLSGTNSTAPAATATAPAAAPAPTSGLPGFDKLGQHAGPVGALGLLVAGGFLTSRIGFLRARREQVMLGLGLNAIDTLARAYMPASVKKQIGLGNDEAIYDSALRGAGEYVNIGAYESEMGEYVNIGAYESEMGEYVNIGAEEDLGSLGDAASELQIGTGIGTPSGPMLAPVPSRAMVAAVPSRSFTETVPTVGGGFDDLRKLYTGIFRGGYGC
jgi:hypothetical protein